MLRKLEQVRQHLTDLHTLSKTDGATLRVPFWAKKREINFPDLCHIHDPRGLWNYLYFRIYDGSQESLFNSQNACFSSLFLYLWLSCLLFFFASVVQSQA